MQGSEFPASSSGRLLLRARVVFPVSGPPIENGAVLVDQNRIRAVGSLNDLQGSAGVETRDLGEVILMPGLVNAHCHLDYTSMAGLCSPPKRFTDWIKLLTSTKAGWSYSDFAESWLYGAKMLVDSGTTTVGDIETLPELLPEVWEATPMRVLSFLEMTGVKSRRKPRAILNETLERIGSLKHFRCVAGLSPHAPYSTLPELLRLSTTAAAKHGWRICTHVAESSQEFEMYTGAKGEMFDWLRRSERDMSDCGQGSPVQQLEKCGLLGENLLAVHVNYLAENDAGLLAKQKVHVVHCPRSHEYFAHAPFPFQDLLDAGVNICLGTDSLASVRKRPREMIKLDLFEEMRTFARKHPKVPAERIVQMSTQNGARALGLAGKVGELASDAFADLIAIPFDGTAENVCEAIVNHEGPVSLSMIDGQWACTPQTKGDARRLQAA